jgi:hypothetical protein
MDEEKERVLFFLAIKMMLDGCKFTGTYFLYSLTCAQSLMHLAICLAEKNFPKIQVFNFYLDKIHYEDSFKKTPRRCVLGPYILAKFHSSKLSSSP